MTESGHFRLTAPRREGSHADRFWAAALADARSAALVVLAAAGVLIAAALPAVIVTIVVRHCLPLLCVLTNDVP